MIFNEHSNLKGDHAFLSASKYHWINYTPKKLEESYLNHQAQVRGTILHDFASQCIKLRQKLPESTKTLNMYVNDAIGFKMTPEQVLYYSNNCFGTADAISFRNDELRIHDLKTGVIPANIKQLMVYSSLFYLEYDIDHRSTKTELRLYQNDGVSIYIPEPEEIDGIIHKIKSFDKLIESIKLKEV